MKAMLIALAIVVAIAFGFFVIWTIGFKRMASDIGKPTPEEARVKIDKAEAKATAETDAAVEEVRNATLDENIDLGRDLSERGRTGRLRK